MSDPIVNKVDREVILSMIAQKYQIRISALDDAIKKVITEVGNKVNNLNQRQLKGYHKQLEAIREEVNEAAKVFQESLKKKFHGRKVTTVTGLKARVAIDMNALSTGVSLRTGAVSKIVSENKFQLARRVAEAIDNHISRNHHDSLLKAANKYDYVQNKMRSSTEFDTPEFLNDIELVEIVVAILELGWRKDQAIRCISVEDISASADATPQVFLKSNDKGFQPDNLRIVEHPEAILQVTFQNVSKKDPLVKEAKAAVDAAADSIKKLAAERNALVQEFNDVTVRISIIRTPEKILEIAQELGLISKKENYDILKAYDEKKHLKLLAEVGVSMKAGGLKALPAPKTEGVDIIDAEAIDIEDED